MEVFYCKGCNKWHDYDDAGYEETSPATWEEPAQYSEEIYCEHCGEVVEENNVFDCVLDLLNNKRVTV